MEKYTKIIAEVAQSFEGKFDIALLLIKAAANAGADAVKFQLVYADELATPDYKYYNLFKSLEMPDEAWERLAGFCKGVNIELQFDVFGTRSLSLAERLGVKTIKLHATDISNVSILNLVVNSSISTVILGVGGANQVEILNAVNILKGKHLVIMVGFQGYPTNNEDNQISRIAYLRQIMNMSTGDVEIGYADHSDPMSLLAFTLPAMAIGAGATVLEKHLTLGKIVKMEDYESALNPDEFSSFSKIMKDCKKALGVTLNEEDFGMSNSERDYRVMIRRHVVANEDLLKDTVLKPSNLVLKRTSSDDAMTDISQVYEQVLDIDIKKNTSIKSQNLR